MSTFTPGDAIPDFSGGRNIAQTGKTTPSLQDVLQGHDDAIVNGVAASLSSSAPVAVGLAAASGGTGTTASKSGHVHQISAALGAGIPGAPTVSIGSFNSGAHSYPVTIQLKDILGTNWAQAGRALVWISDTAVLAFGTALDTIAVTSGNSQVLNAISAAKIIECLSDASGQILLTLTKNASVNRYLNVLHGTQYVQSAVLAFS